MDTDRVVEKENLSASHSLQRFFHVTFENKEEFDEAIKVFKEEELDGYKLDVSEVILDT